MKINSVLLTTGVHILKEINLMNESIIKHEIDKVFWELGKNRHAERFYTAAERFSDEMAAFESSLRGEAEGEFGGGGTPRQPPTPGGQA